MRDPFIEGKFQHLGVNHEELDFIGACGEKEAENHGVESHALAGSGRAGDQ